MPTQQVDWAEVGISDDTMIAAVAAKLAAVKKKKRGKKKTPTKKEIMAKLQASAHRFAAAGTIFVYVIPQDSRADHFYFEYDPVNFGVLINAMIADDTVTYDTTNDPPIRRKIKRQTDKNPNSPNQLTKTKPFWKLNGPLASP